ncbi:hypothetical protein GCM10027321_08520 [Massilia terrae]|uniref:Lipoprotein n=1 Tax=Massilia terrae TaxID=1811224 RepID=A0ABT2D013_9BURK|nr:hypothetical protein [Massilia terrae]MCS0659574.1 hypothetical protein [Massilia terrae]
MTLKRFALLCAALPLLLSACAGDPPAAPAPKSVSLTLAPGQKADAGGGMTLAYDSYSDSRCPKTVWCVWAGELVYRFTLAAAKSSDTFSVTLPNTWYVSKALGGTRIAIDPASVPPPAQGSAAAQYILTLTVSRP